jgi:hypothetical protein
MRKLLLTALLLPLLGKTIVDPGTRLPTRVPPPGFPLHADGRSPSDPPRPGAIIVPLNSDAEAFTLTAPEGGVPFDIDGDGVRERVSWPEAGIEVAFLALDRDGDGRITSIRELFGRATEPGISSGYAALLHAFQASGAELAGSIREGHALYDRLLLWVDRNHDGRSEPGELIPARDRFTAIGLGFSVGDWADARGNRIRYEGWLHARTAGAEQRDPRTAEEERERRRRCFEVTLKTLDGRRR